MQRRNFIKSTSVCAILIPHVNLWKEVKDIVTPVYDDNLKKQVLAAFKRFKDVWNFNDFWKRGNTFDACLVFAAAAKNAWPDDVAVKAMQLEIGTMLEENYNYFHTFNPGDLWADDFGWWGLMALNAQQHLLRLNNKELADKYFDLSINLCWRQEKEHAYDFSSNAKPVPHGCSNGDANGKNKGVKNTVTNVLFFLLSVRVYHRTLQQEISDNDKYLEMAYRQWVWFDSWFKLTQFEYLKHIGRSGALVQERPTAFIQNSDYNITTHPTWQKGWIWTGDQGMLLAALTEMLAIKNNLATWISNNKIDAAFNVDAFEKTINAYIHLVSKGIKTALISNVDDIIREAPFNSNMGPEFGNDYLAGRGILMRYLGGLNQQENGIDFNKMIKATAEAIWQTRRMTNNQFQPEFTMVENDKRFIAQFRKLTGVGDDVIKWQINAMNEQQKNGVCQSIGLDALGALIHQSKKI